MLFGRAAIFVKHKKAASSLFSFGFAGIDFWTYTPNEESHIQNPQKLNNLPIKPMYTPKNTNTRNKM